jgi:peptidoglycan hydrolase-like protein with peptidoglycan-binding domain
MSVEFESYPPPRRSGWRRAVLCVATLLPVAVAAGAWLLTTTGAGAGSPPTVVAPPAAARVTRQDLADTKQVDGTLGYGEAHTVASEVAGVVTWLPAEGAKVTRGQPLYRVDNLPVVLMYGTVPPYRVLKVGVDDGTDVKELEQNLSALGYSGFTVDEHYTDATAQAVRDWQKALGLPETGSVEPGRGFVTPDAVRVATLKAEVAGRTAAGQPVLMYTGTARLVTVDLDVTDEALARTGAKVTVTLPEGKTTKGTVTGVGTVAHKPAGQNTTGTGQQSGSSSDTATIDVTVTLDDPAAGGGLDAAPVDVDFVSEEHRGVLTVPVAALLALREGGYGLEVVDGTTTRLVAVQVGLFANGRVEVSGPDIAEGATVGVPKS